MKTLKRVLALCTSTLLAVGLALGGASAATAAGPVVGTVGTVIPATSDNNNENWWTNYGEHDGAQCYKHGGSGTNDHGTVTDNGLTVTLKPFNQDWPGDHWELLAIKAGNSVNVIQHPSAGVAYASPVNNGGNQATVSHWIVCKGTTPSVPKDASAEVVIDVQPTCTTAGTVKAITQHATLVGQLNQSPGSHSATFNANSGHQFGNGQTSLQVNYTVPGPDPAKCPKDATAEVKIIDGTCTAAGSAQVHNLVNATLNAALDTTQGTHTATFTATAGHLFSNGTTTLSVEYTVPGIDLTKCDHDATAEVSITQGTCTAAGSAQVVNLANATWDNVLDTSVGTHSETFTAVSGSVFSNGQTTLTIEYTVPGIDLTKCANNATAKIETTPGTCTAIGTAQVVDVANATWDSSLDTSVGTHSETFTAVSGSVFSNGQTTLTIEYTITEKDPTKCPTNECVAGVNEVFTNVNPMLRTPGSNLGTNEVEYADGALRIEVADGNSKVNLSSGNVPFWLHDTGVLDIDATSLSGAGLGLNLYVDFNNDGTPDGTLVYEEVYGQDLWLTGGSAQFVKDNAPVNGGGNGSQWHGTIDQWLTKFPEAKVLDWAINLGRFQAAEYLITKVQINCADFTFDVVPQLEQCDTIGNGGVSTNTAPNGWAGDGFHVFGGYKIEVPGNWAERWVSRAVNQPLSSVLAGLDIDASPSQYVGLHFTTSDNRVIVYEEEPSYNGNLWSTSAFTGVPSGLGYAAFGSPEQFAAQNGDLVITSVRVLYTSPVASSTTIKSVTFGCDKYTFDLVFDPPVLPDVNAAVSFGQMTCTADGTITLSNDQVPGAVIWTVNGQTVPEGVITVTAAGVVTVTAAPKAPEYGFTEEQQTQWTFTFAKPTCPSTGGELPTLALTGTDSSFSWFAAAAVLLLAGLGSTVVRARRSSAE